MLLDLFCRLVLFSLFSLVFFKYFVFKSPYMFTKVSAVRIFTNGIACLVCVVSVSWFLKLIPCIFSLLFIVAILYIGISCLRYIQAFSAITGGFHLHGWSIFRLCLFIICYMFLVNYGWLLMCFCWISYGESLDWGMCFWMCLINVCIIFW